MDQGCSTQCDTASSCWPHVDRSYNRTSGWHFYTNSDSEAACCGYTVEAYNYFYLYATQQSGLVPFYRCVLSNASHFYTTSSNCEGAAGARLEGSLGYIAQGPTCGSTPLYRLRGPTGDHFYTISSSDVSAAEAGGYASEGVSGYVWTSPEI
jgi:hypothetical protein